MSLLRATATPPTEASTPQTLGSPRNPPQKARSPATPAPARPTSLPFPSSCAAACRHIDSRGSTSLRAAVTVMSLLRATGTPPTEASTPQTLGPPRIPPQKARSPATPAPARPTSLPFPSSCAQACRQIDSRGSTPLRAAVTMTVVSSNARRPGFTKRQGIYNASLHRCSRYCGSAGV